MSDSELLNITLLSCVHINYLTDNLEKENRICKLRTVQNKNTIDSLGAKKILDN